MLIQGSALTKRTNMLIDEYCSLLESGVKAEDILVLLQNPLKKNSFINTVKSKLKISHFENPQIYTFFGLCYNTVLNNWPFIENLTEKGTPSITPNLIGLEVSQFLIKHSIREVGFNDYNSKINLIHQIFRRFSLISNNNLTDEMVRERSKVLKEVFDEDAASAINIFKSKTLQYRAFDYIRQLNLFNKIYTQTDCFGHIRYLLIDDADEITPCEFDFIKAINPQLVARYIGYDRNGSSRLGFLNTDVKTVENLELFFKDEDVINLDDIKFPVQNVSQYSFSRRLEMLQKAFERVQNLLKSGVAPSEIIIISPIIDSSLKFTAKEYLEPMAVNYQFISGSEKLCENKIVKNSITLLKMSLGVDVDIFEVRAILCEVLNIPMKYTLPLIEEFKRSGSLKYFDLGYEEYNSKLKVLVDLLIEIANDSMSLSEKINCIYDKLFEKLLFRSDSFEKFIFFVKQIQDFENVFYEYKNNQSFQKSILTQLSNSIISENPSSAPDFLENSIIISTAQKVIDFSLKSKYQIWLDTTSHEWQHDDFGTLYNAWVFQKSWDKEFFTNDDNILFSDLKAKKMLRKLSLLSEVEIFLYSSLYDNLGCENLGRAEDIFLHLIKPLKTELVDEKSIDFSFIPREDQKPVLEYTKGTLAVSAVPGAGKTTVLLALIIKLLRKGVSSENIFVLTYMDSAARNFKERIKKACPNLDKLPNISTIHGLALRILKENANYVKVGLDENFDICDDSQRQKILRESIAYCKLDNEDYEKYDKGISSLKLANLSEIPFTKDAELLKFLRVYKSYNTFLRSRNLIDYDDMLSYSVKILKENPDIAQYYQNLCHYVIEDEAQDSSSIQQELLAILCKIHKNLIRCGDINQSITASFANTNPDGFKNFVNKSKTVAMTQSQRCTKDVFELANNLIKYSETKEEFKNAFHNLSMQEVKGQNPVSANAVEAKIFDDYNEENSYILEKIRKIFASDKNASIAILVRKNSQIEEYSSYFSRFGYNVISGNESLNKQPVFNLVFSLLKFCAHPWQNETILEVAKTFANQKLLDLKETDFVYIKDLKTPFIIHDNDSLPSQSLTQLLWDLNYWLENSSLSVDTFTIKVGQYYYCTELENSNTNITAIFLKNLRSRYVQIESFLEKLDEIKFSPLGSKYKFFDIKKEEDISPNGSIQIMTYHKSKGSEFDCVFIPGLNEEFLQFKAENIKIKSKERFLESVKALNFNYKKKDERELKLFQIEENLRLLYVSITRAKKKLYITTAQKYKIYSRVKKVEPSMIFSDLLNTCEVKNAK